MIAPHFLLQPLISVNSRAQRYGFARRFEREPSQVIVARATENLEPKLIGAQEEVWC
jgi:hypothetical protein